MIKVSILTQCYNGEEYLDRFFKSILNQTNMNMNIEFIFVNDGSTDNTKKKFLEYKKQFEKKNIKTIYIEQENQGQAAAVNNGLKHVTGKYLSWLDSDDELFPGSVEKKVEFLENNPEYSVVFSEAAAISEETGKMLFIKKLKDQNLEKRDLIRDFLYEDNIYVTNGCYMINFEEFKKANLGLDIAITRGGQNWQILLPLANKVKFGYLPEVLFNFFIKETSHSTLNNEKKSTMLINEYEKNFVLTLKKIDLYEKYKGSIEEVFSKKRIEVFFKFNNKKQFEKEYNKIKENGNNNNKYKVYRMLINNTFLYKISNSVYKTLKKIGRRKWEQKKL